jgi:antitoxin VapB
MAIYVKSKEVSDLAEQVAAALCVNKTEAIRRALTHELERARDSATPSLVERGLDLVRKLHETARPAHAASADKAFIDRLYDDA